MGKTIILLLLIVMIFASLHVFSRECTQSKCVKETVLEYPYKSARLDKVKYIDDTEIILENIASTYKKFHTVVRNLKNNNRIAALLKKTCKNIKDFIFNQSKCVKETVLEYPYKSARLDKVKYTDDTEIILENISSIYKKFRTVVRNLENNNKITAKTYENIKDFIFKRGLLLKQQ